jgi:hypothetical protein
MNDAQAPRRAYFASLSTPELIVSATVERGRFDQADLALIREELGRRGLDADRLAVPSAPTGETLGITPEAFATPLPGAWLWWREGWQLFSRHFGFLAATSLVFTFPFWLLDSQLSQAHDFNLSLGLAAHLLFRVAYDSLAAACVFQGLHRRMVHGRGSVGLALAKGMQCWGRVFRESVKAYGLALGLPVLLFASGRSVDAVALKVFAWIFLVFPGTYLLTQVLWVQPVAVCQVHEPEVLSRSRRYSRGRTFRLYSFLILSLAVMLLGEVAIEITKAILPKPVLEPAGAYFLSTLSLLLLKTTGLVGYYHVSSQAAVQPADSVATALPEPPGLAPQP